MGSQSRGKEVKISKTVILILLCALFSSSYGAVVINEFMASNGNVLQDPNEAGEYPDWIEFFNSGSADVNLAGYFLTDNLSRPTKWQFPSGLVIKAQGFLLLYADNDVEQGDLHTNFKLNADAGRIALIDTDGLSILDSLTYENQYENVSYGRYPDGSNFWYFFDPSTPDKKNVQGFDGQVEHIEFSQTRGFYDTSFDITLSTKTPGATIYYTTNGTEPNEKAGAGTIEYTVPINISSTTCVRALAVKNGWKSTPSVTHTFVFLNDVIRQPEFPDGFPDNWAHTGYGDYEMDPEVVDNPLYKNTIVDDLKSIPSLSLVMDVDDWFDDRQGIYIEGELDERAVSAELICPDGAEGFQINCAVMIVGGTSTNRWKSDKLSMRLKFQAEYGAPVLEYPLFGHDATDEFDTIVVDARLNNAWSYGGGVGVQGRDLSQRDIAQYTRDPFVSDIQNSLGGTAPHGRHVHLYLNGLYWGLYWLHERPDEHFAASYYGGDESEYDVLKHNIDTAVNGTTDNYRQMFNLANSGLETESKFDQMQQLLDIPDFINYMITNFYLGNWDWAHQNWYASRKRIDPTSRWHFHSWDAEHVMESLDADVTTKDDNGGPTRLHQKLKENSTYRRLFADRMYEIFFNDGLLTSQNAINLYNKRLAEVDRAVVPESARWGDNRRDEPYTRNEEWVAERDWLLDTYFPERTNIVLEQLQRQGLYPKATAPRFIINGKSQDGGIIQKGDILTMATSRGTIYYTTDGSDPVTTEDSQGSSGLKLVQQDAQKQVLVPKSNIGTRWRIEQNYDDSSWKVCEGSPGGVGYEKDSGYESWISLDVGNDMHDDGGDPNPSCFIRIPFSVQADDLTSINSLTLKIRYDDGFAAYLNGEKVASANVEDQLSWNSTALENHEAQEAEFFDISPYIPRLREGKNLLAIQGLNIHTQSSDFIITAELTASDQSNSGFISPTALEYTDPITLNESIQIKARTLDNNEWSALHNAYFIIRENLTHLKITEIHFHPLEEDSVDDREFEFIELKNTGSAPLNLGFIRFVQGISYTFRSGTILNPDKFIVLVSNRQQFTRRYGIDPYGTFEGNLNNGGERITLANAAGDTIFTVKYNDQTPWPEEADGEGYSLVSVDANPTGNPDFSDYWSASYKIHGSPGADDKTSTLVNNKTKFPKQFQLYQNFPNPFNPKTTFHFSIPIDNHVRLRVYNLLGQLVETITDKEYSAGDFNIQWDASHLAGGVYFYRFDAQNFSETKKFLLLK